MKGRHLLSLVLVLALLLQPFGLGWMYEAVHAAEAAGGVKTISLLPKNATWEYSDTGVDQSEIIRSADATPDPAWSTGAAPLGYAASPVAPFGNINTVISYGTNDKNKHITSYFRKSITVTNIAEIQKISATIAHDDGFVLYVNGTEVLRGNMPEGEISYSTEAVEGKSAPLIIDNIDLTDEIKGLLNEGENIISAEVHQQRPSSSDLYWDMLLDAQVPDDGTDPDEGSGEENGSGENPGEEPEDNEGSEPDQPIILMSGDQLWKINDTGTDLGTAWRAESFDDAAWTSGNAPLGFSASTSTFGNIATTVSYGSNSSDKHRTTYFRTELDIDASELDSYERLVATFGYDDGFVLYVNGEEVQRGSMPEGEITYSTFSSTNLSSAQLMAVDLTDVLKEKLKDGRNVIAAEVHQSSKGSSDLYWAMKLETKSGDGTEHGGSQTPEAISLTFNGDPKTSMGFAWYTSPEVTGTVLEIVEADKIVDNQFPAAAEFTFTGNSELLDTYLTRDDKSTANMTKFRSHKANATGLTAGTRYAYRLGDGNDKHWSPIGYFATEANEEEPFTFLFTTDSQGTTQDDFVIWNNTLTEGMKQFPDAQFAVITGDQVDHGDIEEQWLWFFNEPSNVLRNLPLMPVVGNHESKGYSNFTKHFNLPNESNTDAKPDGSVYSFEYGPAKIMVLNTEYYNDEIYNNQVEWLKNEVAKTDKKWKIVMLHKAMYSVANHSGSSDVTFFRNNLSLVFDELGIDVVLSGHDHTYTRSYQMYNLQPIVDVEQDQDGHVLNPDGTLHLLGNSAGNKFYTPKDGPFPYAAKYEQPRKQVFTGITLTDELFEMEAYTTLIGQESELYDTYSIRKTEEAPRPVTKPAVKAGKDGKLTISWTAPTTGEQADKFRIYEANDKITNTNGDAQPNWNMTVVAEANVTKYSVTLDNVKLDSSYQFVIKAVSNRLNSAPVVVSIGDDKGNSGGNGGGSGNGADNGNNEGNDDGADNGNNEGNDDDAKNGNNEGNDNDAGNENGEDSGNGGSSEVKTPLTDMKGHWAEKQVQQAVNSGFVSGYGDGTFRPDKSVNRAEFATMLARALKLSAGDTSSTFTDSVSIPQWAASHIEFVSAAGIMNGYSDGSFRPERFITRAELITAIVRAVGLPLPTNAKLEFQDSEQVPTWAVPYVAAAVEAGITHGVGGNKFAPNEQATRAEAIVLIQALLEKTK